MCARMNPESISKQNRPCPRFLLHLEQQHQCVPVDPDQELPAGAAARAHHASRCTSLHSTPRTHARLTLATGHLIKLPESQEVSAKATRDVRPAGSGRLRPRHRRVRRCRRFLPARLRIGRSVGRVGDQVSNNGRSGRGQQGQEFIAKAGARGSRAAVVCFCSAPLWHCGRLRLQI